MEKIVIITDTWADNINGVVTGVRHTKEYCEQHGFEVRVVHPKEFMTVPLPSYPEIRLAVGAQEKMDALLAAEHPDYIHIATEGPTGLAARRTCLNNHWRFTTSYQTHFPEYIQIRLKAVLGIRRTVYRYLRWFHKPSASVMVSTDSLRRDLEERMFRHVVVVPQGGVDTDRFKKNPAAILPAGFVKPVYVFLGRLAPEKNIEAFLACDLSGTKLIIGDGPQRADLENAFPNTAHFVGFKTGQDIVDLLSVSDVFIFPSKTDTFGTTMLEALACDLPVAAFDVPGPQDIVTNGVDGYLGPNLKDNAVRCLGLDRTVCRKKALQYSWKRAGDLFVKHIVPIHDSSGDVASPNTSSLNQRSRHN